MPKSSSVIRDEYMSVALGKGAYLPPILQQCGPDQRRFGDSINILAKGRRYPVLSRMNRAVYRAWRQFLQRRSQRGARSWAACLRHPWWFPQATPPLMRRLAGYRVRVFWGTGCVNCQRPVLNRFAAQVKRATTAKPRGRVIPVAYDHNLSGEAVEPFNLSKAPRDSAKVGLIG